MLPTFAEDEVLWSNRIVYRLRAPRRGEVVVVDHPVRPLRLVKRIAGVPGDVVNGRLLAEDEYFVRGDNSSESTDSDNFGPVQRRMIRGRVVGTKAAAAATVDDAMPRTDAVRNHGGS